MMSSRYFASNTFYDTNKKHAAEYLSTHFNPGKEKGAKRASKKAGA